MVHYERERQADMAALQYQTRGGSAPAGKAKVYFCSHSADREKYFEKIAGEILEEFNCAVYVRTDPFEEGLAFDLQQMNLFVVPVTTALLTGSDPDADRELAIAKESNIPILPLMQESGLDALFAKKFGELQYLDEAALDDTAIPYREKLKTFLSAVLYGDELAEKVRAAFDAYIFLSYRKKDRQYAQKLMRLIHGNDFCRDVAVWYDEFLTPGEDFNDLIADALEKSSLFVLAVTPNVVNELNYIMSVEYPLAREQGKPIAPVEMVKTDPQLLKEKYEGIPDAVYAEDREKLAQLLKEKLSAIALSGRGDARHEFFMGLAYLSGIDVEKDAQRALELLESSANAGLDEAYEKLVDIYYYGDGVPQDYKQALDWEWKLGDKYGQIAEASRSDADLNILLQHRLRYGQLALDARFYEEAAKAYEVSYDAARQLAFTSASDNPLKKIFGFAKKVTGKNEYFADAVYDMLLCCGQLMRVFSEMGLADRAAEWGKKAAALSVSALEQFEEPRMQSEAIRIFSGMGDLCLTSGNVSGAEQWYEKADGLIPEGMEYGARLAGIRSFYNYSRLSDAKGDHERAYKYGETAYQRCKALYEEYRQGSLQDLCLELLLYLSGVYENAGKYGDSADCLDDAMDRILAAEEKGSQVMLQRYKSLVYFHRGSVLMSWDKDGALQQMEKGLAWMEQQAEEAIDARSAGDVVYAFRKMGDAYLREEKPEEASVWYEKAAGFMNDTVTFTRSVADLRTTAGVYEKLFDTYCKLGYGMVAKKWYDLALYSRDAVAQSTKLAADTEALAQLKEHKKILKNVYRAPKGVDCLIDVLQRLDPQPLSAEETKELEHRIGEVMKEFWRSHPRFAERGRIGKLGQILAEDESIVRKLSAKDVEAERFAGSDRVTKVLMDSYLPYLKYEEAANLILAWCGCESLSKARHVIGGKENAQKGFERYFGDIPMLYYPLEKVEQPRLWQLLYRLTGFRL